MNARLAAAASQDLLTSLARVSERVAAALTLGRVRKWALLALVAAIGVLAASYLAGEPPFDVYGHPDAVDLTAHLAGGQIVQRGDLAKLYDVTRQSQAERELLGDRHPEFLDLYVSPPFVAYFYIPLTGRPYLAAAAAWTGLSVVIALVSLRLLWPLVPGLHRFGFGAVALVCFSSWPTIETITAGQDSAIALLLLVAGLRCLVSRRDLTAGALLGLGAFKPTLFILIPLLLLLQRRTRALTGFVVVGALLAALSVGLVGVAGLRSVADLLSSEFWRQANAANWWKMQSLPSILQLRTGFLPTSALTFFAVLTGQIFLWQSPVARYVDGRDPRLGFAQAILITGLVSPHFFLYDCIVLLIPALLLLDSAPDSTVLRLALLAAWLGTWTSAIRFLALGSLPFPLWLLAAPTLPLSLAILAWHLRGQWSAVAPFDKVSPDEGRRLRGGEATAAPLLTPTIGR